MLLYYLTENLLYNFPPGALMYFVIGWTFCKYGSRDTSVEEIGEDNKNNERTVTVCKNEYTISVGL